MKRVLLTASALFLATACARSEPQAAHRAAHDDAGRSRAQVSEPTHYLNEWFAVGAARCRLQQVERAITELSRPDPSRVAADLFLVDARLACEDGTGSAMAVGTALAEVSSVAWLDDRGDKHGPSSSTVLRKQVSDEHLLFEVPAHDEGLPFPRSYDAMTGDPIGQRERRAARLLFELPRAQVAVAPWPRGHNRALDLLLDRLARTLATAAPFDTLSETQEAHEAIETAKELYARSVARLSPKLFRVRSLDSERAAPRVTLALEQSTAAPLVSFTFELTSDRVRPSIARLLDAAEAQAAIECGETKSELAQRALQARKQRPERELCNALGTLLPGPCRDADQALLKDALEVGTRCAGAAVHTRGAVPADFSVRLQRGRSPTSFDPTPRYTFGIERSGRVSFHGAPWLSNQSVAEGQSSGAMVALLHAEVSALRFLERAGHEGGAHCKANDERGDVLFVRAGGRERSVRDRDGCRGPFAPEELAELRRTLEMVTAVAAWTTPNANPRERDPDIWIVAAE